RNTIPTKHHSSPTRRSSDLENKVKENIMKQLLALICGTILIVAYAQAQTDTKSSTTTSSPATTSMTSTGSTTSNSGTVTDYTPRSEEHTSELQSRGHLVCRL